MQVLEWKAVAKSVEAIFDLAGTRPILCYQGNADMNPLTHAKRGNKMMRDVLPLQFSHCS